ncbi:MAG: UDP-N-acetylmuramate--L-alanine ligase [Chitinophagales bacterium]|nr:UDP-N-acetylmuramate--L-alanine ligase [Chitinophagales bacterium]
MDLNRYNKIFLIGIGGIGMSALARYFKSYGKDVSGYDKTPTALTNELMREGIPVFFEDRQELYPADADLVVYTPAIPAGHIGLQFYRNNGYEVRKRSEILGAISANYYTIAVAGSHGKTTVSSMIAHILQHSGFGCTAFLGGIALNYNSNFILGQNDVAVMEADEFDRSFHRLAPDMAVITAVDTDHLDIYGTKEKIDEAFAEFAARISADGLLVIKTNQSIRHALPDIKKVFYALHDNTADVYCAGYRIQKGSYHFRVSYFGEVTDGWQLYTGGFHNVENALAAISIARALGITVENIREALATFKGIRRRFEKVYEDERITYIDDYAHHPEEIRVLIESVRELYPGRRIMAVFQPHLFTRTRDLAVSFASELSKADEVVLLDIYPAREEPIPGVTSQIIARHIRNIPCTLIHKEQLPKYILSHRPDILLTIGAGDIDTYTPVLAKILAAR